MRDIAYGMCVAVGARGTGAELGELGELGELVGNRQMGGQLACGTTHGDAFRFRYWHAYRLDV